MSKKLHGLLSVLVSFTLILSSQLSYAAPGISANKRYSLKTELDTDGKKAPLSKDYVRKVEAFRSQAGQNTQIRMDAKNGIPRSFRGAKGLRARGSGPEAQARNFIKKHQEFLGVDADNLKINFTRTSPLGTHAYFQQFYKGVPVENAYVKVHFNKKGDILQYQSTYQPGIEMSVIPLVTADSAASTAAAQSLSSVSQTPKLVILFLEGKDLSLAWKAETPSNVYFINANNGEVLLDYSKQYAYQVNADLYKTYPTGALGTERVVLEGYTYGYYKADQTTLVSGVVPAGGTFTPASGDENSRFFAQLSGDYFTVHNSKKDSGLADAVFVQPDTPDAGQFHGDGGIANINAKFIAPVSMTLNNGKMYLLDSSAAILRTFDSVTSPASTLLGTGVAGSAFDSANPKATQLKNPQKVFFIGTTPIVADTGNNRILMYHSPTVVTTIAGSTTAAGGDNGFTLLNSPSDYYVVNGLGSFIADTGNDKVKADINSSYLEIGTTRGFSGDGGNAALARLRAPEGVVYDSAADIIYIADTGNNRIRTVSSTSTLSDLDTDATINTFAGGAAAYADNVLATSTLLNTPVKMTIATVGGTKYLFLVERGGGRVRAINLATNIINTVAGGGTDTSLEDALVATSVQLSAPSDVFIDGTDLYIAESGRGVIRRVDLSVGITAGVIYTHVGNGPGFYSGSGDILYTPPTSIQSPHPYLENATDMRATNRTVSVCTDSGKKGYTAAFMSPVFNNSSVAQDNVFAVGEMNDNGLITRKDVLNIFLDTTKAPIAVLLGSSIRAFFGPLVMPSAGNSIYFQLKSGAGNAAKGLSGYRMTNLAGWCVPYVLAGKVDTSKSDYVWGNAMSPEVNAFYQLNQARNYFQTANLNNNDMYVNLSNYTLPVMVNFKPNTGSTYPMLNAFYDADLKAIFFGEGTGGRNFALENSVVRHEYVHYVIENIWPLTYFGEGAAISEAVADFFALSSLRDPVTKQALTSEIGTYVNTGSGEGKARNLSGQSRYDSAAWAANEPHQNSLVLSQTLWRLRESADLTVPKVGIDETDKLVWYALMFFPDTLLEFRESMLSACDALSGAVPATCAQSVAQAFDDSNITATASYDDVYEPNNGPLTAYGLPYNTRKLTAALSPVDDVDYYVITVPQNTTVNMQLTMPIGYQSGSTKLYFPMALMLLNDQFKILEEKVQPPSITAAGYTSDRYVKMSFTSPASAANYTGRYIIGVYRPEGAADSLANTYTLDWTYSAEGSLVDAQLDAMDKTKISVTVPYVALADGISSSLTAIPSELQTCADATDCLVNWAGDELDTIYYVRLLGNLKEPLPNATTEPAAASQTISFDSLTVDTVNKTLSGTITMLPQFITENPYISSVYVEVFGVTRNGVNASPSTTAQNFSYGISAPVGLNNSGTGGANVTRMYNNVFNPNKGTTAVLNLYSDNGGSVKADIYTVTGVHVKKLYDGPLAAATAVQTPWDGKNDNGHTVSSGVYILLVKGAGIDHRQKIAVVR